VNSPAFRRILENFRKLFQRLLDDGRKTLREIRETFHKKISRIRSRYGDEYANPIEIELRERLKTLKEGDSLPTKQYKGGKKSEKFYNVLN
jgi:hypothetical protein